MPTITKQKCIRDFSKFNQTSYIDEIKTIDFTSLIDTNVNKSMSRIINTLQTISDKHAPIKRMSNKSFKQHKKPWITKAILVSIKKKPKIVQVTRPK